MKKVRLIFAGITPKREVILDPNKTLEEIRHLSVWLENAKPMHPEVYAKAQRLAELTMALDSWLSQGGFFPAPWDKRR